MFACIHIPDFPVQASLLPEHAEARATLNRSPIAILDGPASLPRVFAANLAARRAGIQLGMTKLQAEVCTRITLRKRLLAEEESAQSALLECAAGFSPRVESTASGVATLDLTGTEKLFRPGNKSLQNDRFRPQSQSQFQFQFNDPWHRAAQTIRATVADAGFDARIAIAANPDTAILAARGFPENTIIPAGQEARHLASLSIEALPISPAMLETLNSWGIRTFQSLAALPEVALVERLGGEGLHMQKLARGAVTRPLLTLEATAGFAASFEFDDPVETLESIFYILGRLLDELCSRLISASQAAGELRLTIGLNVRQVQPVPRKTTSHIQEETRQAAPLRNMREDHPGLDFAKAANIPQQNVDQFNDGQPDDDQFTHAWKLPAPTQDKNLLFNLIRLHLEKTIFTAPIRCLRLEAVPVKPRLAQGDLFLPPSPEPEKLELTLERIRGVVGSTDTDGVNCVGSPHLLDTHKSGTFTLQRFSSLPDVNQQCHPRRSEGSMPFADRVSPCAPIVALRIFRPALETKVELDGAKPHFVHLASRHRRVLAASGPWTTSGNWWNAAQWFREEWDVVLKTPAGPGFYRIYRDRLQGQWFVEGVFD